MKNNFDTIVIGAGPGGLAAAFKLSEEQKVLVIEKNLWGGTCPNYGCDPKKLLYGVIESKRQAALFTRDGVNGDLNIDWKALMAFKKSYTDSIPEGTEQGLEQAQIAHVHGAANFIDSHTIQVGAVNYRAENIIIATGASPAYPDIPGKKYLQNSNDFLAMENLPPEIAFIGSGYVSIELANIAAQAGAKVHIIQHNKRILRSFPEEYAKKIVSAFASENVTFHWDSTVTKIVKKEQQLEVKINDKEKLTVQKLFTAMGRPAAIEKLALEKAGIHNSKSGIEVDDHLRTAAANIYAVGDVVDKKVPKLTPVAGFEGAYVADTILGSTAPISYPMIPHTVFAGPELSQVGVSLRWAKAHPDDYKINEQDVGSWYTYLRIRDTNARVTTIIDKRSQLLAGAVVYATAAEELINYLSAVITEKLPAAELSQRIPVYPSVASDLKYFF
ncbi:dihydrolipoyl dehydrogenase family protein [Liquorilactobacillus oeni]|uniref:dihydrolipoyl dehydrogenase family protein n=1 Tax=Liquorilactobacillus oeni TaxID=303241 RepID=UPI00070C82E7|nr:NAD(P)/FAD-dependent oxidoreductase [Liquorilactobacillus oeni]